MVTNLQKVLSFKTGRYLKSKEFALSVKFVRSPLSNLINCRKTSSCVLSIIRFDLANNNLVASKPTIDLKRTQMNH